ncbi:hypothetical protein A3C09_01675 [Candidatus Uhrbacteria bacterium RIFCSPHIGHO2_02_FULL_47_44]|uniref:Methyltransferase domain-containing protein n=1 Tax=Candidatus Uhrbacteria bacterium RIFCSPLOWO2_02_FULL_48_18 TaxID=1802408 RepID=A0A1F7V7Z2_9BACT|nr:MAG: hypothetical protein A2839_03925 [Candidatus Uhrbacteria bacterium RIFCSPHIGHO2_01_FULL_47_10]OGL69944.1 MAG: hypothetical protein A3C09_01675 [Candidatus Uhrbacteria bacterium RIFCSPHIGHO2_02_FULL_47_44]OGL75915.1 MAG: hypothetical protein A3E97_03720 [Candidatus Uhrbacteria bacterium RIFCSPHIGHO2_12_FULL_47_12]OGL82206.1 MAG: hypothetical protein A3B20_00415 [Candidatus Uhrbacteria bacterium RIFCSPLOWO2_01_FULL_47_17]OGL86696.1 MAG: hypothetical protein A3I41_05180 [Candidatus Uhrbact
MWVSIIIYLMLFVQFLLLCLFLLIMYLLVRGIFGVPFVRSNKVFSRAMMELAQVKPGEVVVDYGSGDGAIVNVAAKEFGAKGIGFEYLRALVLYARARALLAGVSKNVEFRRENFLSGKTLPKADVVSSYLFPEVNAKLEPLLIRDYPSGTRVVSRTFLFQTLPMIASKKVGKETVYLYQIP